ncbi:MAG: hypothetical protein OHK93_007442 [Ramalina farinacea]|uniref:Uncharacterized protein n=1 Tax=Ramalina farinacea TaxID=258253 RepID=A0AA43QNV6_9LECA|nr:hypothetical protein [Ramalina farinacea]
MTLSSYHPSTEHVLWQIHRCQRFLNEIHDNLGYTQAYGLPVPPTTIQTWRIITDRLDYITYRWETALQKKKKHTTNMLCSQECEAKVVNLWDTLERARDHEVCAADSEINMRKSAAERWSKLQGFEARYGDDSSKAPDVEAYRALCSLQRYTEGRGWIINDVFGATWSKSELSERKETSEKHIQDFSSSRTSLFYKRQTWRDLS